MKTLDENNRQRKTEIEKLGLEPIKENPGVLCPKCRGEMYYWTHGICFLRQGAVKDGYDARNVCMKISRSYSDLMTIQKDIKELELAQKDIRR